MNTIFGLQEICLYLYTKNNQPSKPMNQLITITLSIFCLTYFSCSFEESEPDYYAYSAEQSELLDGKDWYITGLTCDGDNIVGDFDTRPFLEFPESGYCDSVVYLLDLALYKCHLSYTTEDTEYYWLEANNVGELEMTLFTLNLITLQPTFYEFKIFELSEDRMTMFLEDFAVFPEYEQCWVTLESR